MRVGGTTVIGRVEKLTSIGRDGFNRIADMRAHLSHIDVRFDGGDSKPGAIAHRLRCMACRDQRFGGHAAVIQAIAAHGAFFNQHDGRAHGGGGRRH